jgi:uncharacterized protein (TIGR02246 family)
MVEQASEACAMTTEVRAALDDFDGAFAAGNAGALSEIFATDGRLLLLHREPLEGRPAILGHWARFFADYDTAAWRTEHDNVDVHGDRAYTVSVYSETLVPRRGGASRVVHGRLVRFLRRDADGAWRVTLAMNSHSRPVEEVAEGGREGRDGS